MRFSQKLSFVLLPLLIAVTRGMGQPISSPPGIPVQNQVFISVGFEPELVTTIGYIHLIGQSGGNLDFHMGAGVKFAPLILSNGAVRVNLIGAVDWNMPKKWKTRFASNLYLAHDNNRAAVMNGLGIEIRSTTLHFGRKWTKGFELGWQYTGLTHIRHSQETKDTFNERYPGSITGINGPKDGWYKATASRFRLGFVGSKKLGDQWNWQFGIGTLLSIQKQGILLGFSHAQVPLYLESSFSYHF